MTTINVLYISIEGNTRSFLKRLQTYANQMNSINPLIRPSTSRKSPPKQSRPTKKSPSSPSCPPTWMGATALPLVIPK